MKAKRFALVAILSLAATLLFAERPLLPVLSSFRVMGELELRTEKSARAPVRYRTLNHEGGMKVTVLEALGRGTHGGADGQWLYVLLTEPLWVDSGEWIEKYARFLIFLPDDLPLIGFTE